VYETALVVELRHCGIRFERQLSVPIVYRGVEVGLHRIDLFVATLEVKRVFAGEH